MTSRRVFLAVLAGSLLPAVFNIGTAAGDSTPAIRRLALPEGQTISPESDRRLMSAGADGTIYGLVGIDADNRLRAMRWSATTVAQRYTPVHQGYDDQPMEAPRAAAVVSFRSSALVTVSRTHDGAYIGTQFSVGRWRGSEATDWNPPDCANAGYDSALVYAADGARVALTLDPSANSTGIDLQDASSVAANLPRALIVEGSSCTSLGNAFVTALRGANAVGYLGSLDGKPAPHFVNLMVQRMTAFRWTGRRKIELGAGVPYAVTSGGSAVGATALPGHSTESVTTNFFGPGGTYRYSTPHACVWPVHGAAHVLFDDDVRSVAWDVNDNGTIVGMVVGRDGKHRAFRAQGKHVQLLDNLPHPAGWRFESAYAVTRDGAIVGIGTFNGIASAFVWRPSTSSG